VLGRASRVWGEGTCYVACPGKWIIDPPFPENAGKGQQEKGPVIRLAWTSGSLIHPSQKTLGRASRVWGEETSGSPG